MTQCPSIEEIERALGDGRELDSVRAHLLDCDKCRSRAKRVEENIGFLRYMGGADLRGFRQAARAVDSVSFPEIPGIEGFELLRELHRGGQGVVYLARQTATKRTVAIKMLLSASLATSRQRRRFEREIEIAAGLRHPRIVTVFESGSTSDGWMWFAMEFVEGVPLDVYLNQRRPPMNEVLSLMACVCDAVAYAHQRGIIHRDLKPANILVDHEGHPHVLDFGLAKVTGSASPDALAAATQDGEFMGTFAYAAPEQFHGSPGQIDMRADVYALGTILYEALTGQHPFPASGSLPEFIRAVDKRDIVRPSRLVRGISPELEAVVLCALSREPARRYQSAGMLGQDIQRVIAGEPVEARRDSRWYLLRKAAHRHRFATTAAGLFVLVAVAFAVMATVQARRIAHERDKALSAEQATARTAETLAAALRESNIERGRLLVRSGSSALGERMIWREWLASSLSRGDVKPWPPEDDAYWSLWELYSRSPCRRTIRITGNPALKIAINRDATLAAAGTANGKLRLLKLPELQSVGEYNFDGGTITALAFSPRDDLLVTGDDQGFLTLWDADSGVAKSRIKSSAHTILSLIISGDGSTIIVHHEDRKFSAWKSNGEVVNHPTISLEGMRACDADSSSRRIAIGGSNDTATILDLDGKSPFIELPRATGARQDVTALRFSMDGTLLALGREDGSLEIWDLKSIRRLWNVRKHRAPVVSLDFSRDGSLVVSAGHDRRIHISDTSDGQVVQVLSGHTSFVTCARFFDGSSRLVTAGYDGDIKIWDVTELPGVRTLTCQGRTVFNVTVSTDGGKMASCAAGGAEPVQIFDMASGKRTATLTGHRGIVSGIAFSPDGSLLATGGYDHDVRLWNVGDGSCVSVLKDHDNFVESVGFCLNGRRLASASDDNTVRIWDVGSRKCVMILRGHTGRCPMIAVSPDSETIASCSIDGTIRVWSAIDGRPKCLLTGAPRLPIRTLCFTPDGKKLLSGGDSTKISIWDIAESRCIGAMDGSDHDIFCIKVSPDGRFVASTSRGGAVQLWSLARQRSLVTLTTEDNAIFAASFTPDGRTLVFGGESGCVRALDLDSFAAHMQGNSDVYAEEFSQNHEGAVEGERSRLVEEAFEINVPEQTR